MWYFFQWSTSILKALSSNAHERCFEEGDHRHLASSDRTKIPLHSAVWSRQVRKYKMYQQRPRVDRCYV